VARVAQSRSILPDAIAQCGYSDAMPAVSLQRSAQFAMIASLLNACPPLMHTEQWRRARVVGEGPVASPVKFWAVQNFRKTFTLSENFFVQKCKAWR